MHYWGLTLPETSVPREELFQRHLAGMGVGNGEKKVELLIGHSLK